MKNAAWRGRGRRGALRERHVRIRHDEPGRRDRDEVESGRRRPGRPDRDVPGDQRAVGLVLPVDLEVRDLVDDVGRRVHRGRAERSDGDRQDDGPRDPPRRIGVVRRSEGADRAGDDPDEGRQQRERPRQPHVVPHASRTHFASRTLPQGRPAPRRSATIAPTNVFRALANSWSSRKPNRAPMAAMTLSASGAEEPARGDRGDGAGGRDAERDGRDARSPRRPPGWRACRAPRRRRACRARGAERSAGRTGAARTACRPPCPACPRARRRRRPRRRRAARRRAGARRERGSWRRRARPRAGPSPPARRRGPPCAGNPGGVASVPPRKNAQSRP